ncbi:MAG: RNA polymerase sporulation sigma factor SigK [Clostridia bacterium]|nr:RNA polymerase sporulation sigma factor SigK [Clostridia bacterium]
MVSYVTSGASFLKPLSPAEETAYIEKCKNGDSEAKNKLIEHNLRLVAHIAKKYSLKGYDNDDMISIGTIGLIKAVTSYNPEKNVSLATYSARCIENEILMTLRQGKKYQNEVLLQDTVGSDKDGKELSLIDRIGCDEESVFDEVNLRLGIKQLYREMKEALTGREQKILELRYGLYGTEALTQKEISSMMGISRSYVSRIEKKAIKKLFRKMGEQY